MNSDIEDMGLILVESTFRHRKEVERLERTLLRDRRVKYFNTLNDITTDLQGMILTVTVRNSRVRHRNCHPESPFSPRKCP